jgi:hypothetical protein
MRVLTFVLIRQWRSVPLLADGLLDNALGNRGEVVVFAWTARHGTIFA